jgi:hypothetical protein
MSSDDDAIKLVDVISFIISGYGMLLISLQYHNVRLFYLFSPSTRIYVGFLLVFIGLGVLCRKYCF